MLTQAAVFLLDVAFGLFAYAFLLRFAMQWLRAPFRNPVGQAVVALTDWAVKPLRRLLPGHKGVDWTTLLLAWLAQLLWLAALGLVFGQLGRGPAFLAYCALAAAVALVKAALWLLIGAVFIQALLSWVAPDGPLAGLLNALTWKFVAPVRRVIPPLGGTLDLSPLVVIVLAQLALMLPVAWLEGLVATVLR